MISGKWDPGIGTSLWFNSEATGYDSDGWKVEFYSIQTGFDLELKKGISGSLRKIKIGSEWRMISTIINTESQLYEDGGYGIFGTWDWNVSIYIILVLLVAIFCGKRRKFG
ncbi:hypothetical protein DY000_02008160 [Brassica cretica]|uniref:Glucodextranase-like C-terminal domain-containing protein n=1 Tax=Brassica cretica TaxID=69181 RepID=A0ABQ7BZW8_BRACR|nr:hypothetical protein DY000_02008160 [Brassica cretica]